MSNYYNVRRQTMFMVESEVMNQPETDINVLFYKAQKKLGSTEKMVKRCLEILKSLKKIECSFNCE